MENKNIHIKFGFIAGIIMVLLGVTLYVAGLAFKMGMQYVAYIPLLVGLILNAMAFTRANDGYVTFGNVFGSCFKATMIATIVMIAWSITSIFVFPEMKEKALNMMHEQMLKNPKVTDEQIDMSVNMFKKYWTPIMIGSVILSNLLYGSLFSLIAAAIPKKKGPLPITSDNF